MNNFLKAMPGLLAMAASLPLAAFDPDHFARVWALEADAEAGVARVQLTADMHAISTDPGLTDIMITDASDQPVPFALLASQDLREPLSQQESLEFSEVSAALDDSDEPPALSPLRLEFMQDGRRLTLSIPRGQPDAETRRRPVLEALIGSASLSEELPSRRLKLQLQSMEATALDCRIRDADHLDAREQPIRLIDEGQRHPYRYSATFPVDELPRAWQLRCFADTRPEGLKLDRAWLLAQGIRDHREFRQFHPEPDANGPELSLALPGAYRVRSVAVATDEANVLADVVVRARNKPEQAWRQVDTGLLSTLPGDVSEAAKLELEHRDRKRFWQLEISPLPSRPVSVEFNTEIEEIAFLPQGQGPWRLYAGSYRNASQSVQSAHDRLIERTRERLGPSWQWSLAAVGDTREAGGAKALETPAEPLPWRQIVLWLVLGLAALILIGFSARLLRSG